MGTIINRVCAIAISAVLLSFSSTTALAQGDCDGWVPLHSMSARRFPVMLNIGGPVLLYGGSMWGNGMWGSPDLTTPIAETWVFDGSEWRFVTLDGPPARKGPAAAYDPVRDCVVLFGGVSEFPTPGNLSDTWEYANDQWTRRQTAHSPPAYAGQSMVFDPIRNAILLLDAGGYQWTYDGVDWTQLPFSYGLPAAWSKLVFDPRDNSILAVPPYAASSSTRWNGSAWAPAAAQYATFNSVVFDSVRNEIVGCDRDGRFYVVSADHPAVLIANSATPYQGTLKADPTAAPLGNGRWIALVGQPLSLQSPASFVVDQGQWHAIGTKVAPNAAHAVAFGYFPPAGECIAFGGKVELVGSAIAETWILRGETWRRHLGLQPNAESGAFLPYVPARNSLVLVNYSGSNTRDWSWDGRQWVRGVASMISSVSSTPPAPADQRNLVIWPTGAGITEISATVRSLVVPGLSTAYGATAFDPVRMRVLFAAGQSANGTYTLEQTANGYTWSTLNADAQVPHQWGRMAYDPERGGVVHFGGYTFRINNRDITNPSMTSFLGSAASDWVTLNGIGNSPAGRTNAGFVYDPIARRILMYGGTTHAVYAHTTETWKLARGPAAVALEPVDTFVVPGETAEVFIIASGGGVIQYQWFKDGVALANSDRITGADSDTLQIQNFTSDDNAEYHVTVHNPCGDDQSLAVQVRAIPACPGDFDDSGGVDANDLAAFINAYERGLMIADIDFTGGIDAMDLATFFASYEAGGC